MIDAVLAIIRGSDDHDAAHRGLMAEPFAFSETQAHRILEITPARMLGRGRREMVDNQG